ncbi:MAG: hypothetical protein QXM68_04300 [Candidatus Aenigmatarchaeota archaeon]|nr:hypothetical protein [Candidatus Aenigmarchaeota archaeon]
MGILRLFATAGIAFFLIFNPVDKATIYKPGQGVSLITVINEDKTFKTCTGYVDQNSVTTVRHCIHDAKGDYVVQCIGNTCKRHHPNPIKNPESFFTYTNTEFEYRNNPKCNFEPTVKPGEENSCFKKIYPSFVSIHPSYIIVGIEVDERDADIIRENFLIINNQANYLGKGDSGTPLYAVSRNSITIIGYFYGILTYSSLFDIQALIEMFEYRENPRIAVRGSSISIIPYQGRIDKDKYYQIGIFFR